MKHDSTTTRRATPGWKILESVNGRLKPRPVAEWLVRTSPEDEEEPYLEASPAPGLGDCDVMLERPDGSRDHLWGLTPWRSVGEFLEIFADPADWQELEAFLDSGESHV